MIDERTEILINRKLDGELTEAESLELDKAMLRSPGARDRLEEYTRLDEAARATLDAALGHANDGDGRRIITFRKAARMRRTLEAVAIAAVVALAVVSGGEAVKWMTGPEPAELKPSGTAPAPERAQSNDQRAGDPFVVPVIEGPRHHEQQVERDVFGVYDEETQSLYLLESSRTQTTVTPMGVNY